MTLIWTQKCNNKQSETVIFEGYFYANTNVELSELDTVSSIQCARLGRSMKMLMK